MQQEQRLRATHFRGAHTQQAHIDVERAGGRRRRCAKGRRTRSMSERDTSIQLAMRAHCDRRANYESGSTIGCKAVRVMSRRCPEAV